MKGTPVNKGDVKDLGEIVLALVLYMVVAPLFAGVVIGAILPGLPFIVALFLTWAVMFQLHRD